MSIPPSIYVCLQLALYEFLQKKGIFFWYSFLFASFFFVNIAQHFYSIGDPVSYERYFDIQRKSDFQVSYYNLRHWLTAIEPGYWLASYLLSQWISFDAIEDWSSILIMTLSFVWLRNYKNSFFWFFILVLGYYGGGVIFSAGRLRFAVIVLLCCGILYRSKPTILSYLLCIFAPALFHFQMVILAPILIVCANRTIQKSIIFRMLIVFSILIIVSVGISQFDVLLHKFRTYNPRVDIIDVIKWSLLFIFCCAAAPLRVAVPTSIFFLASILLVSFDRVGVMFLYTCFLFFMQREQGRWHHALLYPVCVAVGAKSAVFYTNLYWCQNAYSCNL